MTTLAASLPAMGSALNDKRNTAPAPQRAQISAQATAERPTAVSSTTTNAAAQSVQQATTAPSADELKKLVGEMQRKVNTVSSALEFSVDDDTGKSVVKVSDRSTKEVIWQFPSQDALQITRALDRFQQGMLVNQKA
jgi:flagellar protein FlaG